MSEHPGRPARSPDYLSYLLRMCQTHSRDAAVWRASLENPLTQEVLRFATLPDLFAFLRAETGHDHLGAGWDGTSPPASAL